MTPKTSALRRSREDADPQEIDPDPADWKPFETTLRRHGLTLLRDTTTALQINTGLLCNLSCRHCHLCAGPLRGEIMDPETAEQVVTYAAANCFETIDITGGAPELNPHIADIITRLAPLTSRLSLRTNLTALQGTDWDRFVAHCRQEHVILIASFPSFNRGQTDSQRGCNTFQKTIVSLQALNRMGYGREGSDLELHLVSNPAGAFLPAAQNQAEKRLRRILQERWGISFHGLHNFANAPLGRFLHWLQLTGIREAYMKRLAGRFNPRAVSSLMCRTMVSVDWQGYLYDCDFNLAAGLPLGGKRIHISEMSGPLAPGSIVATANHCYACTAGAGFT